MSIPSEVQLYVDWIQTHVPPDKSVIIPVSGGSDSALCFWLLNIALPGRVHGIYIGEKLRCQEWFEQVGEIEITRLETSGHNPEVTRWAYFLERAIKDRCILVGAHTKTELTLGTYSNASRVAMLLPLANTWKSECIQLYHIAGIPSEILASSKRPDALCGRPKEYASLDFREVDDFLRQKIDEQPLGQVTSKAFAYLEEIYRASEAKRHFPLLGP